VAYGQLIIEEAAFERTDKDVLDQIFDFFIRDFSKFALQLSQKPGTSEDQAALCLKMIKNPAKDQDRYQRVWDNHIYPLVDAFEQNP
jgi:acyl-CoA dehydrogenase